MRRREIELLAARFVPGAGTPDIHSLGGGSFNETYRVVRGGTAYALRFSPPRGRDLGIDRVWEAQVLGCATNAGLAPTVEYFDPPRGILISRWVEGRFWTPALVRQDAYLRRLADLVRRIHGLPMPVPTRVRSPLNWIDQYATAALRAGIAAPGGAALRAIADARLAELARLPGVPCVLCHGDLHTLNLIEKIPDRGCYSESEPSLVLLDWEYAHAADPLWDLAGWIANNDLEHDISHELLTIYTGHEPSPHQRQRLALLCWLYDYVCLLWNALYLKRQPGMRRVDPAADGVSVRARLLAARLAIGSNGRLE